MSHQAPADAPRPFEARRFFAILVVDIALPWLAVMLLEGRGVPLLSAVALAALFPVGSVVLSWFRLRRVEFIGLVVVLTMLCGVAVSLASGDVRYSLVKAAPALGLFGAACLASLLAQRPLMFFIARYFSTGGDPAKVADWNRRLELPGFRRAMRRLTLVWGATLVVEAVTGIAIAILVVPEIALLAERVLGIGTIAGLFAWTAAFARRGQAQYAAALARAQLPSTEANHVAR